MRDGGGKLKATGCNRLTRFSHCKGKHERELGDNNIRNVPDQDSS